MVPEHLHSILNHLPLVGFLAALVPLAYGLIRDRRDALISGLLVGLAFACTIPFVTYSGEAAEERFEHQQVFPVLDPLGEQMLIKHEKRAEVAAIAVYLTGFLCLGGLVAAHKKPHWLRVASGACVVALLLSFGLMAVAANTGGKVRHPEFREGTRAHRTLPDDAPGDG